MNTIDEPTAPLEIRTPRYDDERPGRHRAPTDEPLAPTEDTKPTGFMGVVDVLPTVAFTLLLTVCVLSLAVLVGVWAAEHTIHMIHPSHPTGVTHASPSFTHH